MDSLVLSKILFISAIDGLPLHQLRNWNNSRHSHNGEARIILWFLQRTHQNLLCYTYSIVAPLLPLIDNSVSKVSLLQRANGLFTKYLHISVNPLYYCILFTHNIPITNQLLTLTTNSPLFCIATCQQLTISCNYLLIAASFQPIVLFKYLLPYQSTTYEYTAKSFAVKVNTSR
jgi:hypothetical protein